MTPAETALAFAREVLGWDDLYGPYPKSNKALCGGRDGEYQVFDPADLGAVMTAVRDWCRSRGLELLLTFTPGIVYVQTGEHEGWQYIVNIQPPASPFDLLGSAFGDDPCRALMRACLEARRRL